MWIFFFLLSQLGLVSYRFYFHSFLGCLLGGQAVPQHLLGQFPNHCRTWRDKSMRGLNLNTLYLGNHHLVNFIKKKRKKKIEKEVKRLMNMYFFISAKIKGKLPQHFLGIIVTYSVRAAGLEETLRLNTSQWMNHLLASLFSRLAVCQDCVCDPAPFFGFFCVCVYVSE